MDRGNGCNPSEADQNTDGDRHTFLQFRWKFTAEADLDWESL